MPLRSQIDLLGQLLVLPNPRTTASGHTCPASTSFRSKPAAKRLRRSPLAADHHVVPRLIPEVVVEFQPAGIGHPSGRRSRICRRAAGSRPARCPSASPSIEIMIWPLGRQCTVCGAPRLVLPGDRLAGSITLSSFEFARIGGVDDVNPAGAKPGHDQIAPRLAGIGVATAARVPAKVMQLVAGVGHRQPGDDLRVGRRVGIDVDRGQIVGLACRRCPRVSAVTNTVAFRAANAWPRPARRSRGDRLWLARRRRQCPARLRRNSPAAAVPRNSRRRMIGSLKNRWRGLLPCRAWACQKCQTWVHPGQGRTCKPRQLYRRCQARGQHERFSANTSSWSALLAADGPARWSWRRPGAAG